MFSDIAENITLINDMTAQIATAAEEQSQVALDMSKNIENISEQAMVTEGEATNLNHKAAKLNTNANHLKELMSDFDLGTGT